MEAPDTPSRDAPIPCNSFTYAVVMTNPAAHLHDLIISWQGDPNTNEARRRGVQGAGDQEQKLRLVRGIHAALDDLREIEGLLDALEAEGRRTQSFRKHLNRWYNWVIAYPDGWELSGGLNFHNTATLEILDSLASVLEAEINDFSPETVKEVRSLVDEARDLLAKDDTLPIGIRRHLHSVLSHAWQVANDFDLFGDFALQESTERMIIALNVAAKTSTKKESSWKILWNRAAQAAAERMGGTLSDLAIEGGKNVMKELTQN